MDAVRMLGMSLCVTVAATALFSMLIPDSKLERVLRFAVSLFFLCSLTAPFVSGGIPFQFHWDMEVSPSSFAPLEQSISDQFVSLAESNLETAVLDLLDTQGIPVQKVMVETTIAGDGSISISRVDIVLSSEGFGEGETIQRIIQEEVGCPAEAIRIQG